MGVADTLQPKQIKDVRDFIAVARRKDARRILRLICLLIVQRSRLRREPLEKPSSRCDAARYDLFCVMMLQYLYTLIVKEQAKADKLRKTLPPGRLFVRPFMTQVSLLSTLITKGRLHYFEIQSSALFVCQTIFFLNRFFSFTWGVSVVSEVLLEHIYTYLRENDISYSYVGINKLT